MDTLFNNAGTMRNIRLARESALADLTAEIDGNLNGPIWKIVSRLAPTLMFRQMTRLSQLWPAYGK